MARELREELQAAVKDLRFLGVRENLFTFEGKPGHEIVLVYEGRFENPAFYEDRRYPVMENGKAVQEAVWVPIALLKEGKVKLYPEGALELAIT